MNTARFLLFNPIQKILAQRMQDKILDPNNLLLAVWKDLPLSAKEDGHFSRHFGLKGISKYRSVTTREDLGCLTELETANNPSFLQLQTEI